MFEFCKKQFQKNCVIIIVVFLYADQSYASSSSSSYKISAEKVGRASVAVSAPSSASYKIGEGFMRSAYFAGVVFAPIVTSVDPATGVNNQKVSLTILGANFASGAAVKITLTGEADIAASNVNVVSSSKITCDLDVKGAKGGLWTVVVISSDGRSGSLPAAFKITYPAPTVATIAPAKGYNNDVVSITDLAGNYFRSGAAVKLSKTGESDIAGESIAVESAAKITCRFNLSGKAVGQWDITVTNEDGLSGTLSSGFKIESPVLEVKVPVVSEQNPFNPHAGSTKLKYTLTKDADIVIYIFNMRGERMWEYRAPAGTAGGTVGANEVAWDGITAFKAFASTGVYFVHVTAKEDGTIKTISKTKIAIVK